MVHLVLTRLASWSNEFTRERHTHTHTNTPRKGTVKPRKRFSWERNILEGVGRKEEDRGYIRNWQDSEEKWDWNEKRGRKEVEKIVVRKRQMKLNARTTKVQRRRMQRTEDRIRKERKTMCFWVKLNLFFLLHESSEWPLNELLHKGHSVSWAHRIITEAGKWLHLWSRQRLITNIFEPVRERLWR